MDLLKDHRVNYCRLNTYIDMYWGYKLTQKIEDTKNESAKNYFWKNKWDELLFEKYRLYTESIIDLICKYQTLAIKINEATQNDDKGLIMQEEINALIV